MYCTLLQTWQGPWGSSSSSSSSTSISCGAILLAYHSWFSLSTLGGATRGSSCCSSVSTSILALCTGSPALHGMNIPLSFSSSVPPGEWSHTSLCCKTHYYRAPFNFKHFALGDDNAYITGAWNMFNIELQCPI